MFSTIQDIAVSLRKLAPARTERGPCMALWYIGICSIVIECLSNAYIPARLLAALESPTPLARMSFSYPKCRSHGRHSKKYWSQCILHHVKPWLYIIPSSSEDGHTKSVALALFPRHANIAIEHSTHDTLVVSLLLRGSCLVRQVHRITWNPWCNAWVCRLKLIGLNGALCWVERGLCTWRGGSRSKIFLYWGVECEIHAAAPILPSAWHVQNVWGADQLDVVFYLFQENTRIEHGYMMFESTFLSPHSKWHCAVCNGNNVPWSSRQPVCRCKLMVCSNAKPWHLHNKLTSWCKPCNAALRVP